MPRSRSVDDLTIDELRQLLIEKRRAERQARLEHYRSTGRVIVVEPQPVIPSLDNMGSVGEEDEEETKSGPTARTERKRSGQRRSLDRVLLFVEIAAVLGLGFIILNGVNLLSSLNKDVSAVLVQPTLTPTALISAVVLPSGHTPPNSPGGAQPNTAEIPEHLRPLVQSLANLPVPTVGPQQAIRIQIPSIGVDHPVVQGDSWEELKKGVAQHIGTPNPGEKGNVVFSAHNDVFGEIFRYLDRLQQGDKITLFTKQRTYTYVVQQVQIVEPTQVEVMAQTQEPVVTLISCYPYMVDNKRIVVTAGLQAGP